MIKLIAATNFSVLAASAGAKNGDSVNEKCVSEIGFINLSSDGRKMLFDFVGKAEICSRISERSQAMCAGGIFPLSIGGSTVRFMGRELLNESRPSSNPMPRKTYG